MADLGSAEESFYRQSFTLSGDLLIFADNLTGGGDGIVDSPNDSAAGGTLFINFNSSNVDSFSFAFVDAVETAETFGISFFDSIGTEKSFTLTEYIAATGTVGFVPGDNRANQFATISADDLGIDNIQEIEIRLFASGGIDNLTWSESVPEPSSALLSLLGLGFVIRRRR
ncbi:PEP-CTERM sorting domain-containing protein [Akkermansiaceae bacterium]|nr:PEP-CTERM sorting domain-containing protein [Akkermansiaceae bacterium]